MIRMAFLAVVLAGAGIVAAQAPAEAAVVCAKGVVRAGCVGPNGAVVTKRKRPVTCRWVNGRKICKVW